MGKRKLVIEGKNYISSAAAAKLIGYAQDYIGELARSGKIGATKVGRTWFVEEDSIRDHLRENADVPSCRSGYRRGGKSLTELPDSPVAEIQTSSAGGVSKTTTYRSFTYEAENPVQFPALGAKADFFKDKKEQLLNSLLKKRKITSDSLEQDAPFDKGCGSEFVSSKKSKGFGTLSPLNFQNLFPLKRSVGSVSASLRILSDGCKIARDEFQAGVRAIFRNEKAVAFSLALVLIIGSYTFRNVLASELGTAGRTLADTVLITFESARDYTADVLASADLVPEIPSKASVPETSKNIAKIFPLRFADFLELEQNLTLRSEILNPTITYNPSGRFGFPSLTCRTSQTCGTEVMMPFVAFQGDRSVGKFILKNEARNFSKLLHSNLIAAVNGGVAELNREFATAGNFANNFAAAVVGNFRDGVFAAVDFPNALGRSANSAAVLSSLSAQNLLVAPSQTLAKSVNSNIDSLINGASDGFVSAQIAVSNFLGNLFGGRKFAYNQNISGGTNNTNTTTTNTNNINIAVKPSPSTSVSVSNPRPPASVTNNITQRVTESVNYVGVSRDEFETRLNDLAKNIFSQLGSLSGATASNANYISNVYNNVTAPMNRIDKLASVDITDSTWTGGSISGASISGGSISGATIDGGQIFGALSVATTTILGSLTVTNFGTSTILGDVAFDSSTLFVDSVNHRVGIATTSPISSLSIFGDLSLTGASRYFNFGDTSGASGYGFRDNSGIIEFRNAVGSWTGVGTGSGSGSTDLVYSPNFYRFATSSAAFLLGGTGTTTNNIFETIGSGYFSNRLGIGTTSPFTTFGVAGNGYFDGSLTAGNLTATGTVQFSNLGRNMILSTDSDGNLVSTSTPQVAAINATSTTATSTFSGNLSVGGNINLNGAFLQNNLPFIGSQWTTLGSNIYYNTGNVGIGTTSPGQKLSVAGDVLGNNFIGSYFTGTSTATSTFAGGIQTTRINTTTASSTMNGLVLSGNSLQIATLLNCNGASVLETDASGNIKCGDDAGGAGVVTSVADDGTGTMTVTPTAGDVKVALALTHANSWIGGQTFLNATSTGTFYAVNSYLASTTAGQLTVGALTATSSVTFSNLATGLIKSTNGLLSIATAGTDYLAATSLFGKAWEINSAGLLAPTTTVAIAIGAAGTSTFSGGIEAPTIGAQYFVATSTTATSTFAGGINITGGGLSLGSTVSGFLKATAGAITTGLIDLASNITGILGVSNGGTGWSNIQSGTVVLGNGAGAISTTTRGNLSETGSSILTITNGTNAVLGGNATIQVAQANGTTNGFLASADWNTFSGKVSPFSFYPFTVGYLVSTSTATSTFSGGIESGTKIAAPYFVATSTTATSTFFGGIFAKNLQLSDLTSSVLKVDSVGGFAKAVSGTDYVAPGTTITVNGTANQITSSAGAQDLSTNRTWTLSLPNSVTFPNTFYSGTGTTTLFASASSTIGNLTAGTLTATSSVTFSSLATGLIKSTNGLLSIATAGTDYLAATSLFGKAWEINSAGLLAPTTTVAIAIGAAGTSTFSGGIEAPTIGAQYFVATSTTATSTFAGGINITGGGLSLGSTVSGFLKATAGAITTGLIDLASNITGILGVSNGGTGWSNIQSGTVVLGNGAGAISTTTRGNLSETGSSILTITNGTNAVLGGNATIQVAQANGTTNGFLASADWNTFSGKVSPFSFYPFTVGYLVSTSTATSTFSGGIESGTKIAAPYFVATSTTATSTFFGGIFAKNLQLSDLTSSVLKVDSVGGFAKAVSGTDYVAPGTTITVNGTANQITSSAGAQDLSTNRTWTLSLPNSVTFPNTFYSGTGTTTLFASASSTIGNLTAGTLTATSSVTFSSLATGLIKSTNGLLSIATAGTDYLAATSLFGKAWEINSAGLLAPTTTVAIAIGAAGTSTFSGGIEAPTIGAQYFVATSTTATSTFAGGINITGGGLSLGSTVSGFLKATAGAITTGLIDLASNITGILGVSNGGTGWSNIQSGTVVLGNGAGAISTTTRGNLSETGSSILTITNGTNAVLGGNATIQVAQANGTTNGFLASADWNTFSGKVSPFSFYPFTVGYLVSTSTATSTFSGGIESGTKIAAPYFVATSTTATSTFFGGIFAKNLQLSDLTSSVLKVDSVGGFAKAVSGTDYVAPGTTITVNGTANQITSSAGAQDLSTNRTWTLSLPNSVTFPNTFYSGTGTTTLFASASSTIGNLTAGTLTATSSVTFSSLATGLIKSTNGLLSIATAGTDYLAATSLFGKAWEINSAGLLAPTTTVAIAIGAAGTSTFSGGIESGKLVAAPYFNATSTTATSTFSGNLSVVGNINLNGAFLQNNLPFIGSQWTTLGSNIYYNTGNVGIGTTSPAAKLSVDQGSATNLGMYIAGFYNSTADLFRISTSTPTATSTAFVINSNGMLGIGTSSPSQALSVAGNALIGVGAGSVLNWNVGTINFFNKATTTILNNQNYAWSIATGTDALAILTIDTSGGGAEATTTLNSGFVIDGGAFQYDYSSGVTSADNFSMGGFTFDTDAGTVILAEMPVTSDSVAGTAESYSMNINGNSVLTVFGLSDGGGEVNTLRVGIGSTTPSSVLSITASSTGGMGGIYIEGVQGGTASLFNISTTTGNSTSTAFIIDSSGKVGIGTSTPSTNFSLAVEGRVIMHGLTSSGSAQTQDICATAGGELIFDTATCISSSERFKNNIKTLDISGLDEVMAMRPVSFFFNETGNLNMDARGEQVGFIAEEAQNVDPRLVQIGSDGFPQTFNYQQYTAVITKAIQELNLNVLSIASTTASSTPASQSFTASFFSNLFARVTNWLADAANGIGKIFAGEVHTDKLCVGDATSGETCVTKAELDALLVGRPTSPQTPADSTQTNADGNTASSSSASVSGSSGQQQSADVIAPTITLMGNNPAQVAVDSVYNDLGATITGPTEDLNLGLFATVDGGATTTLDNIIVDTSVVGAHSIVYFATDQIGQTGLATRTVIVGETATSTETMPPDSTATATTTTTTSTTPTDTTPTATTTAPTDTTPTSTDTTTPPVTDSATATSSDTAVEISPATTTDITATTTTTDTTAGTADQGATTTTNQ